MRIIGLSGRAGAGKDTVADILVREREYTKIALADPLKRICRDVFGGKMTDEHLWGPSEKRNEPIPELGGLTARKALQTLGTEWGRACYPNVWIDLLLARIKETLRQAILYTHGPEPQEAPTKFVIPDVRFLNELEVIRAAGGEVWRIVRGGGLEGEAAAHISENDLEGYGGPGMPHIFNEQNLEYLKTVVLALEARDG